MTVLSNALAKILEWFVIAALTLLVVAVTWQVVSRWLLDQPDPYTDEAARFLLLWLGLLGAAYAYRTRAHIGIGFLVDRAPAAMAGSLQWVARIAVVVFALVVLVFGGGRLVAITWSLGQSSAALGLPMAAVYSVLPITGLLIALFEIAPAPADSLEPTEGAIA